MVCLGVQNFSVSPLCIACGYGQLAIVRFLLQCGVNIHACDRIGISVLHHAMKNTKVGSKKIGQLLLESGVIHAVLQTV